MEQVEINNKRKEELILKRVKLALIEIGESNNYSIVLRPHKLDNGNWWLKMKLKKSQEPKENDSVTL